MFVLVAQGFVAGAYLDPVGWMGFDPGGAAPLCCAVCNGGAEPLEGVGEAVTSCLGGL